MANKPFEDKVAYYYDFHPTQEAERHVAMVTEKLRSLGFNPDSL